MPAGWSNKIIGKVVPDSHPKRSSHPKNLSALLDLLSSPPPPLPGQQRHAVLRVEADEGGLRISSKTSVFPLPVASGAEVASGAGDGVLEEWSRHSDSDDELGYVMSI